MTPWTDTRYSSPQGSIKRHDTDSRVRMRLLWWVQHYGLSRQEWEAVKACAEQMARYRAWLEEGYEDGTDEPKPGTPDDVLTEECDVEPGSLRSSQLAQVAMEVCHHMGVRLSDYKWKAQKERRRRERRRRERREKERSAA